MTHLLWILFGPGTWGSGGNMVAWVICGVLAGLWLHAKLKAHAAAAAALARLHHKEKLEQSAEQHAELKQLAEKQHAELNRRLDDHADLIAAAAKPAAAKPRARAGERM